jgi:hypothetical protein
VEAANTEMKEAKIDENKHNPPMTSNKKSLWMSESESPNKNRKKEIKKQNLAKGQDSRKFSMVSIKQ